MKYSIILLLDEEVEEIGKFVHSIHAFFIRNYKSFEIILIANGTEGFYKNKFNDIIEEFNNVKIYTLYRKTTQAVCMKAALKESKGDIIIACGSYQQITMESLDQAINSLDSHTEMILPCRKKRVDPFFNQFQSKIFNWLVRKTTGYEFNDLSCTVRIVRKEVLENINFYGNMYRFLPVVAAQKGFRYKEIDVGHIEEIGKTGFYSISEYIFRLLDIFSLLFLVRYTKKPFRFFGTIGAVFFSLGLCTVGYVIIEKIFFDVLVGNNFLLIMGFLLIAVGVQSAATGLLGEIITFAHGRKRKEYTIDKIVSSSLNRKERRHSVDRRKDTERRNRD
jgi:hypothetical protein